MPEFRAARSVMIYLPMAEEVQTEPVARTAWSAGKKVLAPRVDLADRSMEAFEIRSLTENLVPGPYDILQPTAGSPHPPHLIDLVLVPALAFDRRSGRLGRGAGFYDRFLRRVRPAALCPPAVFPLFCGLAFHLQIVDELPMFDHDQRIDIVVTDKEVLDFRTGCASISMD